MDMIVTPNFPDGRLQLWEVCRGENNEAYLLAYNWQNAKIEEIAGPIPIGSSDSSWNPDMNRGVVYLDDKYASSTLYWIWKGGFGPLDLIIQDGGRSWNLKDDFPDFKGADQGSTGNADRPAWSPNGKANAFFGSTDAIGMVASNGGRFGVEYRLYITNAEGLNPLLPVPNACGGK